MRRTRSNGPAGRSQPDSRQWRQPAAVHPRCRAAIDQRGAGAEEKPAAAASLPPAGKPMPERNQATCYRQPLPKRRGPRPFSQSEQDQGPPTVGATGFEPATTCTPTDPPGRPEITNDHQRCATTQDASGAAVQPSQRSGRLRRNFAANLLPPDLHELDGGLERLLTVSQVASRLGVCAATVYKWAATGVLPHVRILNVVRVRPEDLTRFLTERRRPCT